MKKKIERQEKMIERIASLKVNCLQNSGYVQKTREGLGVKGRVRNLVENDGCFLLRETATEYSSVFDAEKGAIDV